MTQINPFSFVKISRLEGVEVEGGRWHFGLLNKLSAEIRLKRKGWGVLIVQLAGRFL